MASVEFLQPWWLLLLGTLPLFCLLGRGNLGSRRRCVSLGLRCLLVACLVLAMTVIILPMFPPHYQLLLLPGGLLLVRDWGELWARGMVTRALLLLAAVFLFWQWASAAVLVAASWLGINVERVWHLPLWTSVLLPIPLAACLVLETRRVIKPRKLATNH